MLVIIYLILSLLFVIFGLLVWILLTPLTIIVDSRKALCEVSLQNIARLNLVAREENLVFKIKTWVYKKEMAYSWESILPSMDHGKEKVKPKKKTTKNTRYKNMTYKIYRVIKSFEIKKLYVNIDTSSYYLNAFLYPIFYFMCFKKHQLNVNFIGQHEYTIEMKNRLGKIIYAIIF